MTNKSLLGVAATLLALTAGCSSASNSNTNKPAASPSATPAASPKPSTAASPAAANQGAKGFALVNNTGVEIHSLYITPSDSKDWQDDILGRDTMPSGTTENITFNRSETAAMWDMRIEDADGNFIEWEDLNLLAAKKVTLHYKNGKATAETE